jgi:biopolymer transport protein ExbB
MLEFLVHGGWAMWIIAGCSIVAVGITFERWVTLRATEATSTKLLDKVGKAIKTGDVRGAIAVCEEVEGPVAETLSVGLRKMVLLESIGKSPAQIEQGIVEAMEEHGGHVVNYLERNLTFLATIASLAPILGMTGTVVGMIKAFGTVGNTGNMTPEAVAVGISEALLCTAGGLIVAAMTTVEYNYFTSRVNRLILQVQSAATEMVERLMESRADAAVTAEKDD